MSNCFQGDHPGYFQQHPARVTHLAATATETQNIFRAETACRLRAVDLIPDANVVGQAVDYTSIQVAVNGVAKGTAITFSTAPITMTAGAVTRLFGPSAAGADAAIQLAAGDVVGLIFTKTGNGLLIPNTLAVVKTDFEP